MLYFTSSSSSSSSLSAFYYFLMANKFRESQQARFRWKIPTDTHLSTISILFSYVHHRCYCCHGQTSSHQHQQQNRQWKPNQQSKEGSIRRSSQPQFKNRSGSMIISLHAFCMPSFRLESCHVLFLFAWSFYYFKDKFHTLMINTSQLHRLANWLAGEQRSAKWHSQLFPFVCGYN